MEVGAKLASKELTDVGETQRAAEVERLREQNLALTRRIAILSGQLAKTNATADSETSNVQAKEAQHVASQSLHHSQQQQTESSGASLPRSEQLADHRMLWERHQWEATLAALRTQVDQLRFSRVLMQRELEALRADVIRLQVLLQRNLQDTTCSSGKESWWTLQPLSPTASTGSSPFASARTMPSTTNEEQLQSERSLLPGWIRVGDAVFEGTVDIVPPTSSSAMAVLRCRLARAVTHKHETGDPEPELVLGPIQRRWSIHPARAEDFQSMIDVSAWSWLEAEAPSVSECSNATAATADKERTLAFLARNETIAAMLEQITLLERAFGEKVPVADVTNPVRTSAAAPVSAAQPIAGSLNDLSGKEESPSDIWGSFGRLLSRWVWLHPSSAGGGSSGTNNDDDDDDNEENTLDKRGRSAGPSIDGALLDAVSETSSSPVRHDLPKDTPRRTQEERQPLQHAATRHERSLSASKEALGEYTQPMNDAVRHEGNKHDENESSPESLGGVSRHPVDETNEFQIHSQVLLPNHVKAIREALPHRHRRSSWYLVYSTAIHGASLYTFYARTQRLSHSILAIRDRSGQVFGAFVAEAWRPNASAFYGTGECFVFRADTQGRIQRYPWTGKNTFFQYSGPRFLAIGGGTHFALWLDDALLSGTSGYSETFDNPPICANANEGEHQLCEFECVVLEVWSITELADARST
ncbi:hypothetical protein CCYA_CCYA19G4731 [Cyanidiococcus yangmingshanensis]|nr:hypothetical protein CCYA_CCYA19G4731 [Cyanidiococcus yangmingshanensis]